MRKPLMVLATLACMMAYGNAAAGETTNYSYDALGRLTSVCDATPYDARQTSYQLDSAGNRKSYSSASKIQTLYPGDSLYSPNGRFKLTFQADSNLVVLGDLGSGWSSLGWSSGTAGTGATVLGFQSDGNLVLSKPGVAIWDSGTWTNYCSTLAVQDDGNVVIRSAAGALLWQTGTGGH